MLINFNYYLRNRFYKKIFANGFYCSLFLYTYFFFSFKSKFFLSKLLIKNKKLFHPPGGSRKSDNFSLSNKNKIYRVYVYINRRFRFKYNKPKKNKSKNCFPLIYNNIVFSLSDEQTMFHWAIESNSFLTIFFIHYPSPVMIKIRFYSYLTVFFS